MKAIVASAREVQTRDIFMTAAPTFRKFAFRCPGNCRIYCWTRETV